MKKVVRSISGISPLAVSLKPYPCPGKCIYCPSYENVPKSYTKTSPVVLRAIDCDYDPVKQVKARLKIFKLMGHEPNKIELIIMGGTFSAYPKDYLENFMKGLYDGLNGFESKTLEDAKKANETAEKRAVTVCIETRPDFCGKNHISDFLRYGVTRVEIGVQTLNDKVQEITKRGHGTKEVVEATKLLRDSAFKVGYHMMLGLPGSSPKEDIDNFKKLFNDPKFKPDQLKIYPTYVIKGTPLEKMFRKGEYQPYSTEQIVDVIVEIKKFVPKWVRIMRVMRDIPAQYIISECKYSHLRDAIAERLKEKGIECNCIRCREVGHKMRHGILPEKIELQRIDYDAADGKEIFLRFEDVEKNILVSLLRLRIPSDPFRPEITDSTALVREIHTYGPQVSVGKKSEFWQHKGFGRKLMNEAERIAKEEFGMDKMVVISGVGVREYFYKLGYKPDGPYVSKKLDI